MPQLAATLAQRRRLAHRMSHGQPIGAGQQFHLLSEISRILDAMGYIDFGDLILVHNGPAS